MLDVPDGETLELGDVEGEKLSLEIADAEVLAMGVGWAEDGSAVEGCVAVGVDFALAVGVGL